MAYHDRTTLTLAAPLTPPLASQAPALVLESRSDIARIHLKAHYRRLGTSARRLRFMGQPSEASMDKIADAALPDMLIEYVDQGIVRGVIEAYRTKGAHAEVALSLEDAYQGRGFGRMLFRAGLHTLKEMGVRHVDLYCMRNNTAVLALVRSAGGSVRYLYGDAFAEVCLDRVLAQPSAG
ncbi:hypothetical protein GCM10011363_46610 [Marivita lacus]|uniref:N-acetyltransferase domain-containing protein n=1 Tax=Marivita lacus TaxID=1323742 RepID=A0ABQ1LIA6_9RHOB|nr:GNAT family N-acetyltransferase [Marivita lacus]MDP4990146.1 GNAT family N-acetyltransferase [Marivita lacus]GGC24879.1 hypothetical protein GCM10011363_46610 [Marivita lacus]